MSRSKAARIPKRGQLHHLFEKPNEEDLKRFGQKVHRGHHCRRKETVYEISDLAYHVLVLMVSAGITVEDVTRELENDTSLTIRSSRKGCSEAIMADYKKSSVHCHSTMCDGKNTLQDMASAACAGPDHAGLHRP